MTAAEKRTFSLPVEQATYIDGLVASGTFATESDVVRAGLSALQDRDEAIDRWLTDDVMPTIDKMIADPSRGSAIDDVRARLHLRHRDRLRG